MEGDVRAAERRATACDFNPLPPHGGRLQAVTTRGGTKHFNPLPPHGGRPFHLMPTVTAKKFQSTPSAWRETVEMVAYYSVMAISIHSLRMEGDQPNRCRTHRGGYFNPLPPHGGRLEIIRELADGADISIHSLRMEGDRLFMVLYSLRDIFQSTPSAWRETQPSTKHSLKKSFQSTPSAWRETAKLHRKAFFISPILVQSCKKGCKRLHSAPEKMVFFEKREKNLVRNLQHLSVRL